MKMIDRPRGMFFDCIKKTEICEVFLGLSPFDFSHEGSERDFDRNHRDGSGHPIGTKLLPGNISLDLLPFNLILA